MYGLPKDVDFTFLLGKQLDSINIARHCVLLQFDERVVIQIETTIRHQSSERKTSVFDEPLSDAASVLVGLLGSTIVDAEGDRDGTLRLGFSNGDFLWLYDETKYYTCYEIRYGDKVIVV